MNKIVLKSCRNVRDIGGVKGLGGKTVMPGRLIRASKTDALTREDCRRLKDVFGVRTIVDLRTEKETEKEPDVIFGCEYFNVPLRPDVTAGVEYRFPESLKAYSQKFPSMPQMYIDMVTTEYSLGQLRRIFEIIFDSASKGKCVLFHCTEGKDRTGIVAALAEKLLGVDEKDIVDDYLYSNVTFKKRNRAVFLLTVIGFLDVGYAKEFGKMVEADKSMLFSIFEIIDDQGGIKEFFKNRLGFTENEIECFRKNMLV